MFRIKPNGLSSCAVSLTCVALQKCYKSQKKLKNQLISQVLLFWRRRRDHLAALRRCTVAVTASRGAKRVSLAFCDGCHSSRSLPLALRAVALVPLSSVRRENEVFSTPPKQKAPRLRCFVLAEKGRRISYTHHAPPASRFLEAREISFKSSAEIACRVAVGIFIISCQPFLVNKKLRTQRRFRRIRAEGGEKRFLSRNKVAIYFDREGFRQHIQHILSVQNKQHNHRNAHFLSFQRCW